MIIKWTDVYSQITTLAAAYSGDLGLYTKLSINQYLYFCKNKITLKFEPYKRPAYSIAFNSQDLYYCCFCSIASVYQLYNSLNRMQKQEV